MEHGQPDPLGARQRVLITGAGGQLGAALREVFPDADARTRAELDVTQPIDVDPAPGLVLHAAAWTDVDGAESDEEGALRANVEGTRHVVALGAPVVYFSSDYVFDGSKREPYVESDEPGPRSAYGRSKLLGEQEVRDGWIVRSSWLFGWTGHNFVRTMLRLGEERDEVSVVADQRGCPTFVGHLAAATRELVGASRRRLARRRRRGGHVGRVRRGDLRGGRPRLPRRPDHDGGARTPRSSARLLGPAQRARGRAAAPALARGAARVPRAPRRVSVPPGLEWWREEPGGLEWLQHLPDIVGECAQQWALRVGEPFHLAHVS